MKLFKWQLGRQNSGYEIFPMVFSKTLGIDCYLIKVPSGVTVPTHRDTVDGKRHYRINIHFGSYEGGIFYSEDYLIKIFQTFFFFRPDINFHEMTTVTKGKVFILSFGWVETKQDQ